MLPKLDASGVLPRRRHFRLGKVYLVLKLRFALHVFTSKIVDLAIFTDRMTGERQNPEDTASSPKKPESYGVSLPEVRPSNANNLPGGGLNTAGGKIESPSYIAALKSIKASDFTEIHKKPCVRDALMTGIGGGFGIGGLRAIFGGE